ncbi:hypothetical protein JR316_0002445 [Psilocybe cubensis]|uniref:Uncharacterized protein n=2 Tax=Psilocybe cubensis TaxID=181762 RepID=A0A8H7Y513_PSICU|nr:hypothetical protein JR316_0002445 [Psilocybe cubensis]KAH9485535.1 hypothetical protein JR316_0002445 [Psilocybe cubensis]
MQSLADHGVYNVQKGRILKHDKIVKDVIATGLHNLTAGEKNLLAKYNLSFKKLQLRRKMKPVTDVATYLEQIAHSDTPPADQDVKTEPDTIEDPDLNAIFSSNLEDMDESDYTTLPRLTEDDVAFDMDEIDADDEEVDTDESISSDEGDFEWD